MTTDTLARLLHEAAKAELVEQGWRGGHHLLKPWESLETDTQSLYTAQADAVATHYEKLVEAAREMLRVYGSHPHYDDEVAATAALTRALAALDGDER